MRVKNRKRPALRSFFYIFDARFECHRVVLTVTVRREVFRSRARKRQSGRRPCGDFCLPCILGFFRSSTAGSFFLGGFSRFLCLAGFFGFPLFFGKAGFFRFLSEPFFFGNSRLFGFFCANAGGFCLGGFSRFFGNAEFFRFKGEPCFFYAAFFGFLSTASLVRFPLFFGKASLLRLFGFPSLRFLGGDFCPLSFKLFSRFFGKTGFFGFKRKP